MPLTRPDGSPVTAPTRPAEPGPTPPRERERERELAREDTQRGEAGGEVVAFPDGGSRPATQSDAARGVSRPRAALEVWTREAAESARAAVDGSVWRARPASLRDREARIRRAEWSGGVPALAIPGRVYGYAVALPSTVLLRAAEQTVCRPARLITLALAVLIPLLVT